MVGSQSKYFASPPQTPPSQASRVRHSLLFVAIGVYIIIKRTNSLSVASLHGVSALHRLR